jgi:FkbM family methyltransferase
VKDIAQKLNSNVENVDTVCSDSQIPHQSPLVCLGHQGECNSRKPIRVIGFDGQKTHVETQRASIYRHFPHLKPSVVLPADAGSDLLSGVQSSFEYEHAAVLDKIEFPGQTVTFSLRNDEGGQILSPQDQGEIAGEAVPVTTIDEYCREKKISVVDFIKIDAEGFDIKVMQGAAETLLHRRVKMLSFEGKDVSGSDWQRQFQVLDTQFGFDCYMNGENNMLVRLTECWNPDLLFNGTLPICDKSIPNHGCPDVGNDVWNRIDGNGYCVHRIRGRTLNALFDQMSLYKYAQGHVGDIVRDGKLAMPWARNEVSSDGKVSLAANRNNMIDFERNFGRKFGGDFRRKWQ